MACYGLVDEAIMLPGVQGERERDRKKVILPVGGEKHEEEDESG